MRTLSNRLVVAVAAWVFAAASLSPISAQEAKPAGVIALAPLDKILTDIAVLAETVGQKERGENLRGVTGFFLEGIDLKRPTGVYIVPSAGDVKVMAFIPVTKFETVLGKIEQFVGKANDVGGGVKEFSSGGMPVYVKSANGWAFVSNAQANLDQLPADPTKVIAALTKDYNFAIQVNVNAIPAELRQMAVTWLQDAMTRGLEESPAADPDDRELQEKSAHMASEQITKLIEEIDMINYGWGVDAKAKSTHVDVTITAVDGTSMAKQFALVKDGISNFTGFLTKDCAANANGVSPLPPDTIQMYTTLLESYRKRAEKEIDDEELDDALKGTAKEATAEFFDVVLATVKQGKIDYGAVLKLQEKTLSFGAGISVAEGKRLEKVLAKVKKVAENEEEFPEIELNVGKHGDINFHSVTVPTKEEEAKKLFGDELEIIVGTGAKSLYIAFGEGGQDLLKKAIDASAAGAAKPVPPSQMNVHLKPIMKFAASMSEGNPILDSLAESVEQSQASDEIRLFSTAIPRGVRGRLQINEGVLKLMGEAGKAAEENAAK